MLLQFVYPVFVLEMYLKLQYNQKRILIVIALKIVLLVQNREIARNKKGCLIRHPRHVLVLERTTQDSGICFQTPSVHLRRIHHRG